jgi:hypothetical protein
VRSLLPLRRGSATANAIFHFYLHCW